MGRCLHRSVPEDRYDRQPEWSRDRRFALVADVRIDNRDEIGERLRLDPASCATLSDSRLLFELLLSEGERALDRLLGDFAFAFWDGRDRSLLLARDPLGERSLHLVRQPGRVLFASLAPPLARMAGAELDDIRLAQLIADLTDGFAGSFFQGVRKIEPGEVVTVTADTVSARKYWNPLERGPRADPAGSYAEALRHELDAAVARRLRRAEGEVGAHLSSGFDSSAVATSAALQLAARGQRLQAFTSAPASVPESVPAGWHADESAIAGATAALHPNIDHHVVRYAGSPFNIDFDHQLAGQPVGSVLNNGWASAIHARAQQAGVSVMLTGEVGNFTISAGVVLDDIADLLQQGALGQWLAEARAHVAVGGRWRGLLTASLRPHLATPIAGVVDAAIAAIRGHVDFERQTFVAPAYRDLAVRRAVEPDWLARSRLVGRARRWSFLQMVDPSAFRKRTLARWGVEERDVTADRRLVEFCFSLPVEARLKDGVRRPALVQALAGRVAPEVLRGASRGLQSADWRTRVDRADLEAFARSARGAASERLLDWAAVEAAVAGWPGTDTGLVGMYQSASLLRALVAARFAATMGLAAIDSIMVLSDS